MFGPLLCYSTLGLEFAVEYKRESFVDIITTFVYIVKTFLIEAKMKSKFTENLKRIMFEKSITQKDLAKKLNTTQSFISAYQTGVRNPKPETIEKIAKALKVSINSLIADKENMYETNKEYNNVSRLEFEELKKRILFLEKQFSELKNKKENNNKI